MNRTALCFRVTVDRVAPAGVRRFCGLLFLLDGQSRWFDGHRDAARAGARLWR